MAEIVNLRQARKTRARAEATAQSDANRAKFGRTRAEKARDADIRGRVDEILDGAKREDN